MLRVASRPPIIDEMEPDRVEPGELVVIEGRNFGRDGRLELDGVALDRSQLRGWDDERIAFLMPSNLRSGMIRIQTDGGRSNSVFLMNRRDIPDSTVETLRLHAVLPREAGPGTLVTVEGSGFGPRTALADLGFHWNDRETVQRFSADSWWITSWSDRRIRFVVPGDLDDGPVQLSINGEILTTDLTIRAPAGSRTYGEPRQYDLRHSMNVNGDVPGLRVLIARLPTLPAQPGVEFLSDIGSRTGEDTPSAWVYAPIVETVETDETVETVETVETTGGGSAESSDASATDQEIFRTVTRVETVQRRTVRWDIESNTPATRLLDADFQRAFRRYLGDRDGVPTTARQIGEIRSRSVDLRQSAPGVARRIHALVQDLLEPDPLGTRDLATALEGTPAAASVYADLAVALMRNSGLPARRHFGILLDDEGSSWEHAWLEVFLPDVGWVPADPALGDGMHEGVASQALSVYLEDLSSATFGTLDDRRITVHMDGTSDPRIYPRGGLLVPEDSLMERVPRLEVPDPSVIPTLTVQWDLLRLVN
jgi:hypothetical protein